MPAQGPHQTLGLTSGPMGPFPTPKAVRAAGLGVGYTGQNGERRPLGQGPAISFRGKQKSAQDRIENAGRRRHAKRTAAFIHYAVRDGTGGNLGKFSTEPFQKCR
jgi:hypothetical protein